MLQLQPAAPESITLLGAHCDDIAIGAGGTVLGLCRQWPGIRVDALVMSGAGTIREQEERHALAALCPGADLRIEIADLPDGRQPAFWLQAKQLLTALRSRTDPQIVIGPQRADAHQDHRQLAELITQEYRNHYVLGYEIVKYESDLPRVNTYVPLSADTVQAKVELLQQAYPSQHGRTWFDADTFTGIMRIRGVQAHTTWAEAFVADKTVLGLAGHEFGDHSERNI